IIHQSFLGSLVFGSGSGRRCQSRLVNIAVRDYREEMDAVQYFTSEANSFAASYRHAEDFQERFRIWTELIDRYARRAIANSCIDIGCGPGMLSFYAAERGLETIGIDASAKMLELGESEKRRRRLDNLQFCQLALPFAGCSSLDPADIILCSSVLEYVEDWH